VGTNVLDFELGGMRIGLLNANLSSSWSHLAAAGALLLGGALAVLRARRAAPLRRLWAATAAVLILLFVVEISPAHVEVDRVSYGKLVYVPLLACLVFCVMRLLEASRQRTVMWVALGALAGSFAVHILGPTAVRVLGWGTDTWAFQVKVGLKEGMELAGWMLLVLALWRHRTLPVARRNGTGSASEASAVNARPAVPRPPVRRRAEASPMGCRQTGQS
jgi:hypothetical protein